MKLTWKDVLTSKGFWIGTFPNGNTAFFNDSREPFSLGAVSVEGVGPEGVAYLQTFEEIRKKIILLMREGKGPQENPVACGEYLVFQDMGEYIVLGPSRCVSMDHIPEKESDIPDSFTNLYITIPTASGKTTIQLIIEGLTEFLSQKGYA